jgi:hypothetical protein
MKESTQTVIRRMIAAGFKRNEFRAQIERIYRASYAKEGLRNPYDYGQILIFPSARVRTQQWNDMVLVERKDALLAQGFGVIKTIYNDDLFVASISNAYKDQGKFTVMHVA